jgi:uncharacterized membrane protein YgcG
VPTGAWAQADLPETDEACINDHAEVVGKADLNSIRSLCRKASREKVFMMVVTVDSLDDFRPRPLSVDRFADTIFDEWDTGYEESGDALMLFISVKENEFRVLMGDRYKDRLRKKASGIVRHTLVPDFRRRKRSRGIRKAYARMYHEVVKPHIRDLKKANQRKPKPGEGVIDFDR